MKGFMPFSFQKATTEWTMVAMLAMPRLPTPMATLEPGARCAPNLELVSSRKIVPGMSEIFLSAKCCRTDTKRGNIYRELREIVYATLSPLTPAPQKLESCLAVGPR